MENLQIYSNTKGVQNYDHHIKRRIQKEYFEAKSVIDIAYDISEGLARAACAGEVNGEVVDLRTVLDSDCELNILTAKDEKGLAVLRHTASHVLAQAVQNLYPKQRLQSDLLLIQDFTMTLHTNHSHVRILMQSKKK